MNRIIPTKLTSLFNSAARVYMNPAEQRGTIQTDSANKIGIYCWVNLFNGKIYVGRGAGNKGLYGRLQDYYQPAYLNHPRNANSLICRALIKYGMSSFALLILEYVDTSKESIAREQHYLYTLDTPYNTLKDAGVHLSSGLGVPKTEAQKAASWAAQWGTKYIVDGPMECKETDNLLRQQLHGEVKTNSRTTITISDAIYPEVYASFYSWRSAADALSIKHPTLISHVKNGVRRPFNGRYYISVVKRKDSNI